MPLGMPTYMASGGHYFGQSRYRFLILPRYDFDLHSIIRNRQVDTKNILIIATQLLDILEHIHDCGYAHSDIKAENIMIGKCSYKKGGAKNDAKLSASNKQGSGNGKGDAAAAAPVSAADKRKINRRLRMTLVNNDSTEVHRQSSKRMAKSKSYAESNSSFSSNKSDDSDFSEDFDKLSDEDDDDEDDGDEELDDEDNSNNENDENDSGMCVCE